MPVAVAGLVIEYAVLRVGFPQGARARRSFSGPTAPPPPLNRRLLVLTLAVLGLVFVGFVAGLNLSWTALAGGALVMVLAKRDTHQVLKLVDWNLLVFFAALFIVVEGLSRTGLPDQAYRHVQALFGASSGEPGLELRLVLRGGVQCVLQRAVRAGGRASGSTTSPSPS